MKKALFISLCVLLLAGTGCKKNVEPEPHKVIVTSVSVKPSSLSLKVGETAQLTATVTPVNADNDNVNWSSSDNSFFRAFKTETGLTPTEWREKHTS